MSGMSGAPPAPAGHSGAGYHAAGVPAEYASRYSSPYDEPAPQAGAPAAGPAVAPSQPYGPNGANQQQPQPAQQQQMYPPYAPQPAQQQHQQAQPPPQQQAYPPHAPQPAQQQSQQQQAYPQYAPQPAQQQQPQEQRYPPYPPQSQQPQQQQAYPPYVPQPAAPPAGPAGGQQATPPHTAAPTAPPASSAYPQPVHAAQQPAAAAPYGHPDQGRAPSQPAPPAQYAAAPHASAYGTPNGVPQPPAPGPGPYGPPAALAAHSSGAPTTQTTAAPPAGAPAEYASRYTSPYDEPAAQGAPAGAAAGSAVTPSQPYGPNGANQQQPQPAQQQQQSQQQQAYPQYAPQPAQQQQPQEQRYPPYPPQSQQPQQQQAYPPYVPQPAAPPAGPAGGQQATPPHTAAPTAPPASSAYPQPVHAAAQQPPSAAHAPPQWGAPAAPHAPQPAQPAAAAPYGHPDQGRAPSQPAPPAQYAAAPHASAYGTPNGVPQPPAPGPGPYGPPAALAAAHPPLGAPGPAMPTPYGVAPYAPLGAPPPAVVPPVDDSVLRQVLYDKLRDYQRELFDVCYQRNTIAVTPTGTGKTMLAFCVAEHLRMKCLNETGKSKPVLFLFNTRSLCAQQHRVCRDLFASLGKQRAERRIVSLSENNVALTSCTTEQDLDQYHYLFGLTPRVLEFLQNGDQTKISWFCCVVFDEAHNVRRESAGVRLMNNYIKLLSGRRPHILGLTATPFARQSRAEVEMNELCAALDACIATPVVPSHVQNMLRVAAQAPPDVRTVRHTELENRLLAFIKEHLQCIFDVLYLFKDSPLYAHSSSVTEIINAVVDKHEGELKVDITRGLNNAVGSALPLRTLCELNKTLLDMQCITRKAGVLAAKDHWDDAYHLPAPSPNFAKFFSGVQQHQDNNHPEVTRRENQTVYEALSRVCGGLSSLFCNVPDTDTIGSKERAVLEQLCSEHTNKGRDMRVLVFVPEVEEAQRMAKRFTTLLRATPGMEEVRVEDYTSNTSTKRGADIRTRFNQGRTKVIFNTTTLEEGIDIPNCTLVIRFFMSSFSIVSLNQCRGRARASEARFVLFVDNDDEQEQALKHLDYEKVMTLTSEFSQRGAQPVSGDRTGRIYFDKVNAERLVYYYCQEMVRAKLAPSMPQINMCMSEQGKTLTLRIPCTGGVERTFSSQSHQMEANVKFTLMKQVCEFLDSTGQLRVPTTEFRGVFEVNEYDSLQTGSTRAEMSGQGKGLLHYDEAKGWSHTIKPYEKLAHLCQNYLVNFQSFQCPRTEVYRVRIVLHGKGKAKPLLFEAAGPNNAGYPTLDAALQNSSLVALREGLNFTFFNKAAPEELADKVPIKAERQPLEMKSYYNFHLGREQQALMRVPRPGPSVMG